MSTTTQILFNSPALHSLKRDQLIKLCKIHSIKASGKNVELIEKLRNHAQTLPRDSPLSIAARSEVFPEDGVGEGDETLQRDQATEEEPSQSANARWGFQMPRPSEQWDVVMDNIEETEEGSQGTLNSLRTVGIDEFGTGMSKSPSVSSSLKSLASSFGLKRTMPKSALASSSSFPASSSSNSALHLSSQTRNDTLSQLSTPYSSLSETESRPLTDQFTFDPMQGVEQTNVPLPGHSLRPGVPAPDNARLSLGLNAPATPTRDQPTTTIRLISNPTSNSPYGRTPQLKPFKTSFELDLGSPQPAGGFQSLWHPSEGQQGQGLYPPLPLDDLVPVSGNATASSSSSNPAPHMSSAPPPCSLTAPKRAAPSFLTPAAKSSTTAQLAVPEPFVFGSPLPQHNVSNTQFKSAAASVLEEMNKRLQQDGVESVGMDLISKLQPGAHALGAGLLGPREAKEAPKVNVFKQKFDELHAEEFSKMEGIDSLVKRRGLKPKADAGPALKIRKSSVGVGHGVGRDRFGRRVAGEAGRLSAAHMVGDRRRSRVIPGSFDDEDSDVEEEPAEDSAQPGGSSTKAENSKEDDAVKAREEEEEKAKVELEERKEKEKEAIKRKLEVNKARRRSSVGVAGARGRVSVGRGGVLIKPQPTPKPSRFGFFASAKSLVQKVWGGGKSAPAPTAAKGGNPKPATKAPTKAAPAPAPSPAVKKAPARPSSSTNPPSGRVPSLRINKDKPTESMTSTMTSNSRSPLPSFAPAPSTKSSVVKSSRGGSAVGTGTSTKTGGDVSSLGTRSSLATIRSSSSGAVSSMGSKRLLAGSGSGSSITTSAAGGSTSSRSRLSSSSRLLAPTASSLAKVNRPSVSKPKSSLKSVSASSSAGTVTQVQTSQSSEGETLGMITNSPRMAGEPWSPRNGRIFSQALTMPAGTPTTVKKRPTVPDLGSGAEEQAVSKETDATTATAPPTRQRSAIGRKPRISRSKVIAKLASQRAGLPPPGSTPSAKAGRTRSSLGVKAQRSSFGGKPISSKGGAGEGVSMSAKKWARQSEYARRKSRVAPIDFGAGPSSGAMDVDPDPYLHSNFQTSFISDISLDWAGHISVDEDLDATVWEESIQRSGSNLPRTSPYVLDLSITMMTTLLVVVVGGGGAGAPTARQLSSVLDPFKHRLILITSRPHFTHLVGCIRASVTSEGRFDEQVVMPYDQLLVNGNGVILVAEVKAMSSHGDGGTVTLADGEVIRWDILVLAPGSRWEGPIAVPTTKEETKAWFARWQAKFKYARDILLVGGGAVAIEFAGEIKDLDSSKKVTIVHSNERLLKSAYPDKFRNDIQQRLLARGVTLILGDVVPESALNSKRVVTRNGVVLTPDLIIPCRGPHPNTGLLAAALGPRTLTPTGHARIARTFQLAEHPRIFACGDIADLAEQRQIAKYEGHATVVAKNVLSLLNGQPAKEEYKGVPEVIVLTNGKRGGAAYLGVAWGLTFGDRFTAHFKSRKLLVPLLRGNLGLNKK
ncbi:hypothetical protein DXG01_015734 [Tephrocybe rancida]|nr:hypothetical protein DXG01_015734 [Tephrocybe rancida]